MRRLRSARRTEHPELLTPDFSAHHSPALPAAQPESEKNSPRRASGHDGCRLANANGQRPRYMLRVRPRSKRFLHSPTAVSKSGGPRSSSSQLRWPPSVRTGLRRTAVYQWDKIDSRRRSARGLNVTPKTIRTIKTCRCAPFHHPPHVVAITPRPCP